MDASKRAYTKYNQNCNLCGDCILNCPVNAISFESGKNHILCDSFLKITRDIEKTRYGCGKCQVNVQCEYQIPKRANING